MARRDKWYRISRTRVVTDYIDIKARSKRSAMATSQRCLGPAWSDTRVIDTRLEVDEFGKGVV